MLRAQEQRDQITRLLSAIQAEQSAAQQTLRSIVQSEREIHLYQELSNLVGPDVARAMIAEGQSSANLRAT